MLYATPQDPPTAARQCVVDAPAAGATLTAAAEARRVHRVTVYRWMKSRPELQEAIRRTRAGFVPARRDQLYSLGSKALFALQAILDNPKSSPAVLLPPMTTAPRPSNALNPAPAIKDRPMSRSPIRPQAAQPYQPHLPHGAMQMRNPRDGNIPSAIANVARPRGGGLKRLLRFPLSGRSLPACYPGTSILFLENTS